MTATQDAPGGAADRATGAPTSGQPDDAAARQLLERIRSDALVTRRDYLRILVTVSGGLAVGGIATAAGLFERHGDGAAPAKKVADALAPGQSVAFRYPDERDRAIAIRLSDGTLVAFSSICTHLACAVLWRADRGEEGELYCPCHEGVFNARSGEATAGPPPRALPLVLLEERDDGIYAVGTRLGGQA